MNRAFVLIAAGAVWALMMAELVKRELLPYLEYKAPPSYQSVFGGRPEPRLQKWKILIEGKVVGSSETMTEPMAGGSGRVRSKTSYDLASVLPEATVKLMGGSARVEARSETRVDAAYQLVSFLMTMGGSGISGRAEARRRGEFLDVTYEMPPFFPKDSKTLPFEENMTLSSTETPFVGGSRLHVNKRWEIHTVELDLKEKLKKSKLYAVVESREEHFWNGERIQVFRVDVRKEPTAPTVLYQMYVNDKGSVIEQRVMVQQKRELRFVLEEERTLTPDEAKAWVP
jgi:hypothetical protein